MKHRNATRPPGATEEPAGARRRRRIAPRAAILAALLFGLASPADSAESRGKWYFGGNLSYFSTIDDIRSNAALIVDPSGANNGVPGTGDPNDDAICGEMNVFCDPRPDELLARETAVEETFRAEVTAGFGLTSWLSLQLDAAYFKADVGPVDAYLEDHFPAASGSGTSGNLSRFVDRQLLLPVRGGPIKEIPVSLSGIVRFRKHSPLNPYVGAGAGMIFTEIEQGGDVEALNERLSGMRIREVVNRQGASLVPASDASQKAGGTVPFRWPLRLQVDDAFEWHLLAGAEYSITDRVSVVFDARYVFADQELLLDLDGHDQIGVETFSEELFRQDGSVRIYVTGSTAPNPLCSENNFRGLGCDPLMPSPVARVDPEGVNLQTGEPLYDCPTTGDFDRDGRVEQCYDAATINSSPSGAREPLGDVVVQGGKIDLSGFAVAIGLRFRF